MSATHVRPVPAEAAPAPLLTRPLAAVDAPPDRPPFPLVESKLTAPVLRHGMISHAPAVTALRGPAGARIVAVLAPAGYGKTTLLAQWCERDARPFAWVSVDEADNDPVSLLAYVACALDRIEPVDPAVVDALAAGPSLPATVVPRLGLALASRSAPVVLVLDGVEHLHEPAAVDALAALIEHVPEGSALVLAGRGAPALPLARLRAEGRLVEIGPDDLRLDVEQTRALLTRTGAWMSDEASTDLAERSEGWPVGLYLTALAHRHTKGNAERRQFSGTNRFVSDYLRLELLAGLPQSTIDFLTHVSVLDRMSGPLCDAVLGHGGAARILESLERAGFLIVALDADGECYRFHHFLRDLLLADLRRREPELVVGLNRRAADWCEANRAPEAAVDFALAAGDIERATRLVGALALPVLYDGRIATVEAWLLRLQPEPGTTAPPAIAILAAAVHALRGRPVDAERWAALAEEGASESPSHDPRVEAALATLRAAMCAHGSERMRADAESAAELVPSTSIWRSTALLLLGASHLLAGDGDRADVLFDDACSAAHDTGATIAGAVALAERSLLAAADKRWDEAEALAAEARDLSAEAGLEDYATTAIVHAASARAAIGVGNTSAAQRALTSAEPLCDELTYALPWLTVQIFLELARAHLAVADPAAARAMLADADSVLRRRPDLGVLAAEAEKLRGQISAAVAPAAAWATTITAAELRLLPLLTTHLTFREIAERLFVSRNTVKTQAISVYRKLGVSSRSEAIDRAASLGLVEAPSVPQQQRIILSG